MHADGGKMKYDISERAAHITPSLTLAISAKAKALVADGVDVVGFGAGEPDFDTPQHIKDAAVQALADGFTKYTPVAGIPALRAAIADKLARENGISYTPDEIVVSCGGKHTLYNAMLALCNPGDEVVIPAPYWVSYPEMVKLAGANPVFLHSDEANGFKMTPEQLRGVLSERTKVVILNSPCNPTGTVYAPEEIRALIDVCIEADVLLLSDEIYEKLVYGGAKHCSAASFGPAYKAHTVLAHGFAKAWSMTGWRLGFCAAPLPVAKAITGIQSHSTSNPVSFAQKGGVAALEGSQAHLEEWRQAFDERRRYACEHLNAMPGVRCCEPQGAFYLFPNIAGTGLSSVLFCERLLEEARVAAVPGVAFGADQNIRLSYAIDMESIKKGLDRLEAFCKTLCAG